MFAPKPRELVEEVLCPACWAGELIRDPDGRAWCTHGCRTPEIVEALLRAMPQGPLDLAHYDNRRVDLGAMLALPPQPIPWRVHGLVADRTLTVLSGESGCGKSWVAQALCTGVARGETVGGFECAEGKALYADGEMGPAMFVDQRLRPTGVIEPEFEYLDMMGLDVSTPADLEWLRREIEADGANLVVLDSLRRLAPSKPENDSDAMAPVVGALAKLARDTGAAIVLVHHKGDGEKLFRGSTAIRDQCDALFGLLSDGESRTRRLTLKGGGKMRYAEEPEDRYLAVSPLDGGVVECAAAEPKPNRGSVRAMLSDAILSTLPARTKSDVAEAVGRRRDDKTFREAWDVLERAGEIAMEAGGRFVVVVVPPRDGTTTTALFDGGEGAFELAMSNGHGANGRGQ